MEPVLAIGALTLFTWAVAIWATLGSDHQDREPEQEQEQDKAQRASGGNREAA